MGISSGETSQAAAALTGLLRYRLMADVRLKDLGLRRMDGVDGLSKSSSCRPRACRRPAAAVAG